MAALLALASSAVWGVSDFVGGFLSRRAPVLAVVLVGQAASLAVLAVVIGFLPGTPVAGDLAWGATGGVAGVAGLGLFYRALGSGRMSVAAPAAAVVGALVPLTFGLLTGETTSLASRIGAFVGLGAIALVSMAPSGCSDTDDAQPLGRTIATAMLAGTGFGVFFICLSRTGDDAGLWPLVGARAASVLLLTAVGVAFHRRLVPPPTTRALTVATGMGDMTANVLFLLATRRGALSTVAVLGSLYPAATVVLARTVLGERITGTQAVGLALALTAVALMAGT